MAKRTLSRPGRFPGWIRGLSSFLVLACLSLTFSSCDFLKAGLEAYTDCDSFDSDYETRLADEGVLLDSVPTEQEQYPMSIIVSQDALNRLFAAVADQDIPELTISENILGVTVELGLDPELPLLQIGGENGCGDCILLEMGFSVRVDIPSLLIHVGGSGSGRYQFPLLIQDNGMESSTVYARLDESEVLDIDISIDGIPDSYINYIEGYLADMATLVIQEYYGNVKIFDLAAWKLGNGDIRLLARGPHIHPETGTVVFGLQSNLVRPLGGAIEIQPTLPPGIDIGMQFHPELIQQIIERMLNEGYIPRSYGTTGTADESGPLSVTMNKMEATSEGLLNTNFRLWQVGGDYCGYADLQVSLGLSITDREVRLQGAGIEVTEADGVGQVLAMADTWLQGRFTQDMMSFSELAINYRELTLPLGKQAEMSSDSFRLDIGTAGLAVYLNLDAVVDAISE